MTRSLFRPLTILLLMMPAMAPTAAQAQFTLPTLKTAEPVDAGTMNCAEKYPATERFSAARRELTKPTCFSCPKGYEFNRNFVMDGRFHCDAKEGSGRHPARIDIVIRGKLECDGGWESNDRCMKCPKGYKANLTGLTPGIKRCIQIKR